MITVRDLIFFSHSTNRVIIFFGYIVVQAYIKTFLRAKKFADFQNEWTMLT